jgi:MFS family permease
LSVTTLGVLLSGTNTSTLDVALPVVARHFNADATQASWIVLSYMLVNTILILVFGRVADLVGRRRLYIGGLAVLTGASVLCGFAPSAYVLAGCRALQAVGAAALITNTTALLADAFPRRLLSTGLSFNVTAALGYPVTGGCLLASGVVRAPEPRSTDGSSSGRKTWGRRKVAGGESGMGPLNHGRRSRPAAAQ